MSKHHTPEKRPSVGQYQRCYETHKPLPIGEFLIYGGSCSSPMVSNADIYVGFDMSMRHTEKQWPWEPGESLLYPIPDMGVPKNVEEFKKLIAWLAVQLTAHKLIHIGCIGGHGRTGTVMAALVTHMTGEKDSITYVRKHYCEKAVESATQVRYLHEHFGIKEVPGAKEYAGGHGSKDWYAAKGYPAATNPMKQRELALETKGLPKTPYTATPVKTPMCIWGDNIVFDKPKKRDILETSTEGT